jgi:hypothetical protein
LKNLGNTRENLSAILCSPKYRGAGEKKGGHIALLTQLVVMQCYLQDTLYCLLSDATRCRGTASKSGDAVSIFNYCQRFVEKLGDQQ